MWCNEIVLVEMERSLWLFWKLEIASRWDSDDVALLQRELISSRDLTMGQESLTFDGEGCQDEDKSDGGDDTLSGAV